MRGAVRTNASFFIARAFFWNKRLAPSVLLAMKRE